jgi:hypothetical protein
VWGEKGTEGVTQPTTLEYANRRSMDCGSIKGKKKVGYCIGGSKYYEHMSAGEGKKKRFSTAGCVEK